MDYLAYPLGMLAVAPLALRALGIDRYGVWTLSTAAVSAGAIIASGFGDSNIRMVAVHRATDDRTGLLRVVRSSMAIHLVLGTVVAVTGWILAPLAARHVVLTRLDILADCTWSFRLAAVLVLVRSIESVCVSTQRAFGRYRAAVQISLIARVLSLLAAGILPFLTPQVTTVLLATLAITTCALGIQILQVGLLLGTFRLGPSYDRPATSALLTFGIFTWIQAVCGLVVSQADRLIAGFTFGAAAVASYGICVQLAQPIWGITAAALHFLFPYLTSQHAADELPSMRRTIIWAIAGNCALAGLGLMGILLFGIDILRRWVGDDIALASGTMLPAIALSTAISTLSVVGGYALLALGRVRILTWLNLIAASVMLASIPWFTHFYGIYGIALARLLFGPLMLLIYIPLYFRLRQSAPAPSAATAQPTCEEA